MASVASMRGVVLGWWPLRGLSGAGKGTRRHVQNRLCPTSTTRTSFSDALRRPSGNQLICRRRFAISSTTAKEDGASTTSSCDETSGMSKKNRILLVDGYALVYRAYWDTTTWASTTREEVNTALVLKRNRAAESWTPRPSSVFAFFGPSGDQAVPKYVSIVRLAGRRFGLNLRGIQDNRQPTPDA